MSVCVSLESLGRAENRRTGRSVSGRRPCAHLCEEGLGSRTGADTEAALVLGADTLRFPVITAGEQYIALPQRGTFSVCLCLCPGHRGKHHVQWPSSPGAARSWLDPASGDRALGGWEAPPWRYSRSHLSPLVQELEDRTQGVPGLWERGEGRGDRHRVLEIEVGGGSQRAGIPQARYGGPTSYKQLFCSHRRARVERALDYSRCSGLGPPAPHAAGSQAGRSPLGTVSGHREAGLHAVTLSCFPGGG